MSTQSAQRVDHRRRHLVDEVCEAAIAYESEALTPPMEYSQRSLLAAHERLLNAANALAKYDEEHT